MSTLEGTAAPLGAAVEAESGDDLQRQVRGGLRWSFLNSLVSRLLSVALGVVMARLLVPEEYGVFAVGLTLLTVLQSMNELGLALTIVRWPGDPSRAARTAMTLSIATSAALFTVSFAAADPIARALGAPDATTVLRILAVGIVADGFAAIPHAMLTRNFLQRRQAIVDLAPILIGAAISITLAAQGYGAASLAWGTLVGNVIATGLVYTLAPLRPRPGWHREDATALLRVGLPLAGTSFVLLAILNTDYVVVGHTLGPAELGFYLLAFNLSSWPPNLLSTTVRRVAVPAYSRLADDAEALSRALASTLELLALVAIPATIVLSVLGGDVIRVLYGEQWSHAADALTWLALLGLARIAINTCNDAAVALGRGGRLLLLQLLWLGMLVPALVLGTHASGIRGAGIAHVVVAAAVVLPAHLLVLRACGLQLGPTGRALLRPAVGAVAGVAVGLALRELSLGDIASIVAAGGGATVVFFAVGLTPSRRDAVRLRLKRSVTAPA